MTPAGRGRLGSRLWPRAPAQGRPEARRGSAARRRVRVCSPPEAVLSPQVAECEWEGRRGPARREAAFLGSGRLRRNLGAPRAVLRDFIIERKLESR